MQQHEVLTEVERARRREYNEDTRAALGLGVSYDEFVEQREAISAGWATFIYGEMDRLKALDPTEVMPSVLARLELRATQAAREAGIKAAKEQVALMLRKAIV